MNTSTVAFAQDQTISVSQTASVGGEPSSE